MFGWIRKNATSLLQRAASSTFQCRTIQLSPTNKFARLSSLELLWVKRTTTIRLFSMGIELTSAQQSVFRFIEERSDSGEPPPTYREICTRFGYRSPKAASDHVAALERKGFISRAKGSARGLKVVRKTTGIPVLGRIAAGHPKEAFAETAERLPLDPTAFGISHSSQAFALRVTGDSMIGRQIFDGDILLFEHNAAPKHGDIVAALIDHESTLKTFIRKDGKVWLRAENPRYADLIPALDLQIQGVARASIRFLQK
jgi:repressor LexA